jgi:hypothetical protein
LLGVIGERVVLNRLLRVEVGILQETFDAIKCLGVELGLCTHVNQFDLERNALSDTKCQWSRYQIQLVDASVCHIFTLDMDEPVC